MTAPFERVSGTNETPEQKAHRLAGDLELQPKEGEKGGLGQEESSPQDEDTSIVEAQESEETLREQFVKEMNKLVPQYEGQRDSWLVDELSVDTRRLPEGEYDTTRSEMVYALFSTRKPELTRVHSIESSNKYFRVIVQVRPDSSLRDTIDEYFSTLNGTPGLLPQQGLGLEFQLISENGDVVLRGMLDSDCEAEDPKISYMDDSLSPNTLGSNPMDALKSLSRSYSVVLHLKATGS